MDNTFFVAVQDSSDACSAVADWVTAISAVLALIFAPILWKSQKRTEWVVDTCKRMIGLLSQLKASIGQVKLELVAHRFLVLDPMTKHQQPLITREQQTEMAQRLDESVSKTLADFKGVTIEAGEAFRDKNFWLETFDVDNKLQLALIRITMLRYLYDTGGTGVHDAHGASDAIDQFASDRETMDELERWCRGREENIRMKLVGAYELGFVTRVTTWFRRTWAEADPRGTSD